jgi:hypothetical protein
MLNLASLRFRQVLAENGGPLTRVSCSEISLRGGRWFEANAYLRTEHTTGLWQRHVFGGASGSGTDRSPLVARFKAVSEAMERWAHWATFRSVDAAHYGFDVDPSSNGMAAFPGVFARQARGAALLEAIERFNLLNWWEGRLAARQANAPWLGVDAFVIESDTPGVTVVLHRRSERRQHAFGHAARPTFAAACEAAAVEMERHEAAVGYYVSVGDGAGEGAREDMHPIEQRSLFFASGEGYEAFCERVDRRPNGARPTPRVVFDGAVPGPWDRYAYVWRVLFEPPSLRFLSRERDYFLW